MQFYLIFLGKKKRQVLIRAGGIRILNAIAHLYSKPRMMFISARFIRDSITWRIDCTSFYWVEQGLIQNYKTQIPFPLLSGSVKGLFHTTRSNFEQTYVYSLGHHFHSQAENCCLPRQSTPLLSFTTTGRPMICFKKSLGVCFLLILQILSLEVDNG